MDRDKARSPRRVSTCVQGRLYSPGGCSVMLLLAPFMALSAGIAIALIGYAIAALIMLIAAIVLTVVLVRQRPARKAAGEGVGPIVILPIVLYVLSVPYLLAISWVFFLPS